MDSYIKISIFCVAALIVLCIIYHSINKSKRAHNLHSKEYRTEIYKNTPAEYQQSIQYLYNRLEQLDEIIVRNSSSLNAQSNQAVHDVVEAASAAERKISEYWEFNKKKANFYYYIGLHYASFTLADKLTEELDSLREIKKLLTKAINSTQSQINLLSKKVDNPKSTYDIAQIKREHKELCKKCDTLRKTRNICSSQIDDVQKRRDRQNDITRQRREYIGSHFGKKGRQWRSRIIAKHKK